jgi:hypothetical protein
LKKFGSAKENLENIAKRAWCQSSHKWFLIAVKISLFANKNIVKNRIISFKLQLGEYKVRCFSSRFWTDCLANVDIKKFMRKFFR